MHLYISVILATYAGQMVYEKLSAIYLVITDTYMIGSQSVANDCLRVTFELNWILYQLFYIWCISNAVE